MAVKKMKRDAEKGMIVDVLKWWTFMASDVIGELCFGRGFDSLVTEEVSCPSFVKLQCCRSNILIPMTEHTIY